MARPVVLIALTIVAFAAMSFADAGRPIDPSYVPIRIADERPSNVVVVDVKPGDHLWGISAHHLDQLLERKASDREISPFWRDVISTNVENLRSGNPDLIYPGEKVLLPEPTNG